MLRSAQLAALLRGPAKLGRLPAASQSERIRGNILRDGRPGRDVSAVTNFHRRDEHRIAANKHAIANGSLILVDAIVVARDGARADVRVRAEPGVADVGQMRNLA